MITKFSEAFRLLRQNLRLFAAIILTVWLPRNILVHYVAYNLEGTSDTLSPMWIEGIFGPISDGALVYSLFQIKSGRTVTYREAIAIGFKNWVSLFAARFVAGFLMVLGLIALVVPGVILAVRYSLLDAAVIIEGKGTSASRARSVELTVGRRWQIFWAAVLFFVSFILLQFAIYLPLGFVASLNTMPVEVVLDCILGIAYAIIQIVIFLFYWEATQGQRDAEPGAAPNGGPAKQLGNSGVTEGPPPVS